MHNTGIQMNQKELTIKDIYNDFKFKKPFGLYDRHKNMSAL